jgi:hypothetical protein
VPGYVWNGSEWRPITSGWVWNGSLWRPITTGWQWNGSAWIQIFSSGTFSPEIRDVSGNIISTRAVNNILYGYRGSTATGTYSYVWQYGQGSTYYNNWLTQTGTGATGSLTGSTLTATYQTSTTDVTRLESAINNYLLYMRFRVTKSGETQESNTVRIHKRVAVQNFQTNAGFRAFDLFQTTYNWGTSNPYSGDRLTFWGSTDWSNTSEITNDRRPDYYIFTYTVDGEVTVKDSRTEDPADPRTPTNASRFQVPFGSSYLGKPVFYDIEAYTSSPSSPTTVSGQTRNISDGTLQAPTNLLLQYNYFLYPNKLYMTWDPSDGGNNNTITYTWRLYRNNVFLSSGNVTGGIGTGLFGLYPSSGALGSEGTYKFEVRVSQTGSTTVTSDFSNEVTIEAPAAFTYSISNRTTTDGIPGDFTISAFAQNTSVSNRVEIDWTDSTNANEYTSEWLRPNGINSSTTVTPSNDYWVYNESGNYTARITARNTRVQYIRISWTKPAGTSALSYRVTYNRRVESTFLQTTVDVGDVTYYDYTYANDASGAPSTSVISVVAYSTDTAGEGLSRSGTSSGSSSLTSGSLQQVGTRQKSRTEFLTYVLATVGTLTVTGNAEPGQILNYTYSGSWSPNINDPGWSFNRTWGITREVSGLPPTYTRGTGASVSPLTGDIGEYMIVRIVATYKDQTPSGNTVLGYSEVIVPAPPSFDLTNNYDLTFRISNVATSGGTFYFGTYTGGTVPETSTSVNYLSPTLSAGSKSVTLFGRAKKTMGGVLEVFDGRRSTTNSVNVTSLGDFSWSVSDVTATLSIPGSVSINYDNSTSSSGRVDLNWADVTGAEAYFSAINQSAGATANSNYRTTSDDYWPVNLGGLSISGYVQSANRSGVFRVSGLNAAGAQSYRITYQIGSTTYFAETTSSSVDTSLPSDVSNIGTTVNILAVRAYRNIDWSGASVLGTNSSTGLTTGSVNVSEKLSSQRTWSSTTPSIPSIPTGVSITQNLVSPTTALTLNWTAGTNSTFTEIYRTTSSTFTPTSSTTATIVTSSTQYIDSGRASGTTYYYFFRGGNSSTGTTFYSSWSSRYSGTTASATAPSTPTGVNWNYNGFSGGSYNWSGGWNAMSGAVSYDYQIQYATDNSGTNTNTVSGNTTGTTLTGSNATKPWSRMRVRSVGSTGLTSSYSAYTAWV